jgi:hypothetical protein
VKMIVEAPQHIGKVTKDIMPFFRSVDSRSDIST